MTYSVHIHKIPTDGRLHTPNTGPDRLLGRHIEHDERSRQYEVKPAFLASTVNPIRWVMDAPVLDQGNLGACTGFALITALAHAPYSETLGELTFNADEARDVYHNGTVLDSIPGTWPPKDTGSTGLAVAKYAKTQHWISGYRHVFSGVEGLKTALQYGPVIMGTNWFNSMFTPDNYGTVRLNTESGLAGGHEYTCDEWDGIYFGFTNSWGPSWGNNGRFFMNQADTAALLAARGDAILFTPNTAPAPIPTPPEPKPVPTIDADIVAAYDALDHYILKTRKAI